MARSPLGRWRLPPPTGPAVGVFSLARSRWVAGGFHSQDLRSASFLWPAPRWVAGGFQAPRTCGRRLFYGPLPVGSLEASKSDRLLRESWSRSNRYVSESSAAAASPAFRFSAISITRAPKSLPSATRTPSWPAAPSHGVARAPGVYALRGFARDPAVERGGRFCLPHHLHRDVAIAALRGGQACVAAEAAGAAPCVSSTRCTRHRRRPDAACGSSRTSCTIRHTSKRGSWCKPGRHRRAALRAHQDRSRTIRRWLACAGHRAGVAHESRTLRRRPDLLRSWLPLPTTWAASSCRSLWSGCMRGFM